MATEKKKKKKIYTKLGRGRRNDFKERFSQCASALCSLLTIKVNDTISIYFNEINLISGLSTRPTIFISL